MLVVIEETQLSEVCWFNWTFRSGKGYLGQKPSDISDLLKMFGNVMTQHKKIAVMILELNIGRQYILKKNTIKKLY